MAVRFGRHGDAVTVDADAVATGFLGREQRLVGTEEQVLEVGGDVRLGDPVARGERRHVTATEWCRASVSRTRSMISTASASSTPGSSTMNSSPP